MESLPPMPGSSEDRKSEPESQRPDATAAVRMRLWTYGGEQAKLQDLVWSENKPIAELIQTVIRDGQGTMAEEHPSIAVAHFGDPPHALAAAKSLQQQLLLSFQREPSASQVVAAIVVDAQCALKPAEPATAEPAGKPRPATEGLLVEANCAQILVSEAIYDVTKTIPGFDFSPKPVTEATEDGTSGTLYELRWTDESTYGHLRKSSRRTAPNLSRERRYTIQSELGRGCMGVVYKAYDEVIGRAVALKTIAVNRNFPNHDELIERLKQEARAAGNLDHPNIITIYDVGQEDDLLYLSMQLVEGKTLAALIGAGNLPPLMDLLSYAEQICNAVGFAHHRGVIHRDLKPANFMLTNQGMIKVLDFGIAKIEDATLTQTGMVVGTPTYMAPEQAKAKKVDQRSDIFSLGSVFYELFTRERPFKGDITTVLYKLIHEDPPPPSIINPALPIGIDAIIRKALAKDPSERFQTCEEMREAFRQQAVVLDRSQVAKPAVPPQAQTVPLQDRPAEARSRRSHRRGRIWAGLAFSLLLAATGVGAWAFRAKVRTGAFPPAVAKILQVLKGRSHAETATPASDGQQVSSGSSAASAGSGHNPGDEIAGSQTKPADSGSTPASATNVDTGSSPPSPPATTESATASAANTKNPLGSSAASTPPAPAGSGATSSDVEPSTELSPFEPRTHAQKVPSQEANDTGARVEGFSRRDVPDLLIRAQDAAGRGEYRLARYEYDIILRLDRQNAAARAGLRRVLQAEEEQ
jgi:serine/threonine-protein kinase